MAKKNNSKHLNTQQKVGLGVGLTAAAVAAAGAYFLTGAPNAKQNRKKVKSWMLKAKAEVLEGLEKAEEMTEAEFNELVAAVGSTYGALKEASKADISDFKKEMKEHWPKIAKEGKVVTTKVTKVVKKPAKKVTKKTSAKTTKKSTKKTAKKTSSKTAKKKA